jgi:hypothetical protein
VLSSVGDWAVVYRDIILSSSALVMEVEVKETVVALEVADSLLSIDCDVAVKPLDSVVISNEVALVLDSVFFVPCSVGGSSVLVVEVASVAGVVDLICELLTTDVTSLLRSDEESSIGAGIAAADEVEVTIEDSASVTEVEKSVVVGSLAIADVATVVNILVAKLLVSVKPESLLEASSTEEKAGAVGVVERFLEVSASAGSVVKE